MSITFELRADSRIRLDDADVTTRSGEEVAFRVEGTMSLTESTLSALAGRRLGPEAVAFSVDDARVVEVPFEDETSLRLETVDVGVETPDGDAIPPDADDARSLTSEASEPSEPSDPISGVLAFTVEGAVENVAADDFTALSAGEVVPKSVTFSVDEDPETDGGPPDDVLFRFGVLDYEIAIWEDGTLVVGRRSDDAGGVL